MESYKINQSLLTWHKPKAHLNVRGTVGRCQTNPLINFKKLHRRILHFLFLFDLWNHLAALFSPFLTSSSSFLSGGNNERENAFPAGRDEGWKLLGFRSSQPWKKIRDLGKREMFSRTIGLVHVHIKGLLLSTWLC